MKIFEASFRGHGPASRVDPDAPIGASAIPIFGCKNFDPDSEIDPLSLVDAWSEGTFREGTSAKYLISLALPRRLEPLFSP
jgi:hypothetical protein